MRSSLRTFVLLPLAIGALLGAHCSLDHLAGGSGAGNPGGSVTVALRAEITIGMNKTAADSTGDLVWGEAATTPVTIYDRSGLPFSITDIIFTCNDFRFMLDPSENPGTLLRSIQNPSPLLSADQHSLILGGGPYICNGLTGQVQPDHKSINLPVAKYTGIKLSFKKEWNSSAPRAQMYLAGTFPYYGKSRRFIVAIERNFYPVFQFAGGIFTLSPGDTTHIELRFDARRWFENIDIKRGIDSGMLQFNQNGDLFIGRCSSPDSEWDYEGAIINGFIASGKVVVY